MTTAGQDFVRDTFKGMSDNFTESVRTGMKVQEETVRFWSELAQSNLDNFRSEWEKVQERFADFNSKNAQRFRKLSEDQVQRGMDAARKAMDVTPTSDPAEMFDRIFANWRSVADVVRDAAEAVCHSGVETWKDLSEAMPRFETSVKSGKQPAGKGRK
ncbi:MAG: hypothetical protein HRF50_01875 [Phycisphaerae bacterium]|jgi:hypothetical protein